MKIGSTRAGCVIHEPGPEPLEEEENLEHGMPCTLRETAVLLSDARDRLGLSGEASGKDGSFPGVCGVTL